MNTQRDDQVLGIRMAVPTLVSSTSADVIPHYIMQYLEVAPAALAVFDETGQVLYQNFPARVLVHSLNPDKPADALSSVFQWHQGLVSEQAMAVCKDAGGWHGKVRLFRPGMLDFIAQVHIAALGTPTAPAFMLAIRDVTVEYSRELELHERNAELEVAYTKLKQVQEQVFRTEKLASIGQLAAGVAHEINNPIAYVKSNLNALRRSVASLLKYADMPMGENDLRKTVGDDEMPDVDVAYLATDLHDLIMESLEGVDRVCKIVSDLKDFSHQDQIDNWVMADVHAGLESTLNIVWNEIKYKAHVVKSYDALPLIECIPSQLNQVFMNLLVNAAQAIDSNGMITISTSCSDGQVSISIGDNGKGIPEEALPRIFDPFFTTKAVGEGTGLGLAISYGILAKHNGSIEVTSVPGEGTLFLLKLPITQPR